MKRTLILLLAATLVASPALAAGPGPDDDDKKAITLAVAKEAAKDVVLESRSDSLLAERRTEPVLQDGDGIARWKMIVGVGLLAGGAGIIANGAALWEDEPDQFGRTKNIDSYISFGVGGTMAFIGALAVRGALAGRGLTE